MIIMFEVFDSASQGNSTNVTGPEAGFCAKEPCSLVLLTQAEQTLSISKLILAGLLKLYLSKDKSLKCKMF